MHCPLPRAALLATQHFTEAIYTISSPHYQVPEFKKWPPRARK
jgi:hypothetical protein